jgi:hemerythrin superfamily protein
MSEATQDRAEAASLPEGDVIRILLEQHARIRELFSALESSPPEQRHDLFDELRALLAVHETGEEMVLRPVSKKAAGKAVADARNHEEDEANHVLAELEKMDTTSQEFLDKLREFQASVDEHAEAEENEEFPQVLEACDAYERRTMGGRLEAVEKMAPTHPHPTAAGSPAAQALTGPFVGMVDRVRDALAG